MVLISRYRSSSFLVFHLSLDPQRPFTFSHVERNGEELSVSLVECESYSRLDLRILPVEMQVRGKVTDQACSILVFIKWPITGILIEFVGFIGLFG